MKSTTDIKIYTKSCKNESGLNAGMLKVPMGTFPYGGPMLAGENETVLHCYVYPCGEYYGIKKSNEIDSLYQLIVELNHDVYGRYISICKSNKINPVRFIEWEAAKEAIMYELWSKHVATIEKSPPSFDSWAARIGFK